MTMYFALLAIGGLLSVGAISVTSLLSPSARSFWISNLGPYALGLGAAVAVVTTAGSLYLSEVLHYKPCNLCWYQRGAAYPLAIVLPVAIVFRKPMLQRLVFPIALIGALISCYHLLIERYPSLESSTCDPTNPCSLVWVRHFGFVTIPAMALSSFLLHLTLATLAIRSTISRKQP